MSDHKEPLDQTRLAVAALAACFAKALGEQDAAFLPSFESHLEKVYHDLRNSQLSHIGAMETRKWVREFLKS
jgi:hypothetical protein